MKAVILVGGAGTRLRPLTYVMPKCLLPVGGVPLLEWTIKYLQCYGINEFIVCVAYLKKQIIGTIGDGSDLGVKVHYAEAETPLGTGGQLKTADSLLRGDDDDGDDVFLTMNGDIVTNLNIRNLMRRHKEKGGVVTIALKKFEVKIPYGYVRTNGDHTIRSFEEKPTLEFLVNGGIYIFEKRILDHIPAGRVCSLETEVFPALAAKGEKQTWYYEDAYWNDVGTMVDFEKVNNEFLANAPARLKTIQ